VKSTLITSWALHNVKLLLSILKERRAQNVGKETLEAAEALLLISKQVSLQSAAKVLSAASIGKKWKQGS